MINILLELFLLNVVEAFIIVLFVIRISDIKRVGIETNIYTLMSIAILCMIYPKIIPTPYAQILSVISFSILISLVYNKPMLGSLIKTFVCIFIFMTVIEITYMIWYQNMFGELIISMNVFERFLSTIPFRIIELALSIFISFKGVEKMKLWVGKTTKKRKTSK